MFSGPESVAESMVTDGLLREDELGALAPPVYFLDKATQKQVGEEETAARAWASLRASHRHHQ